VSTSRRLWPFSCSISRLGLGFPNVTADACSSVTLLLVI
jgi:hypothetical protein